jgi:hypothetical protein
MLAGRLKWAKHRTPTHGYEPTREAAMAAFARGEALLKRSYVRYRGQPGNHLLVLVLPVLTLSGPQDRCDGDLILWNWSQSH